MSISRVLVACVVAGAISAAASIACSSFSSDASGAEDGGADAAAAADGSSTGEGGNADGGTCTATTDLATDPQNCGKCGHSCLAGACVEKECQPVLVGTSSDEPVVDVAVDANRIMWLTSTGYWSDVGHVYACPRGGCAGTAPTSLTGPPISTGTLASDGTKAFFSVPYTGGQQGVKAILPNGLVASVGQRHIEAVRLQMRGGNLYFMTIYEGAPSGFTGHVFRWDGAKETAVGDFASPHNLSDMVVIGGRAFFSAQETGFLGACAIGDPAPSTCMPTDFTTASSAYGSLTTDGTSVIWTDSKLVLACPADQPTCPTPTPLVGEAQLGGLARTLQFDHGHLYVTTAANDIYECALPDCVGTLRKLVHETSRLFEALEPVYGHSLAADDTAVYWSAVDGMATPDGDGGSVRTGLTHRIMKLAK